MSRETWTAKAAVLRARGKNNTLHDIMQAADYLDAAAALSAPAPSIDAEAVETLERIAKVASWFADETPDSFCPDIGTIPLGEFRKLRAIISALRAPAPAARMDAERDPVRYERQTESNFNADGWAQTDEADVPFYLQKGMKVRALYAGPVPSRFATSDRAALSDGGRADAE